VNWLNGLVLLWCVLLAGSAARRITRRHERWWSGAQETYSPLKNVDPLAYLALRSERLGNPWRSETVVILSCAEIAFACVFAAGWIVAR